jgi:UDP-4-amino-4,6-dideoxy-N-acetyl-beta-L-altrosamine transaminase
MSFIAYGKQSITEDDIAAVTAVLRSDVITSGPKVEEFEGQFAAMVGAKHAVVVNSATAALHLAMRVLDLGAGARVITSPITFLSSANCAAFVGATPDFSDIDLLTGNLNPDALKKSWRPDTKAVIAVAYAGRPCDMTSLATIARDRGAYIIEDACHGVGGGFVKDGREWKMGGHPWADITIFSFHPVKSMTTGEGGMLVTNNEGWARRARQLRSHGVTRGDFLGLGGEDAALLEQGPWYYEMHDLGYNYRLTDIQCALGLSQLKQLPGFIKRRQEIVEHYNRKLAGIPWLKTPLVQTEQNVSWHLYTVQIDFVALGLTRTEVMRRLREQGVGSQVLYIPVYLQPWYRKTYGYGPGRCPQAEKFYQGALSLPLFPAMTDQDVQTVLQAVHALP